MLNNKDSYINSNNTQAEENTTIKLKQFKFIRHKSLGRLDISHIISDVSINDSILTIKQQKIILYFFKKQPIETVHNVMDIASMKISRTFDLSDTIFSAIFTILGFFQPSLFIVGIMFLWVAIGKKIQLRKSNNSIISIPAENYKLCSELMHTLISLNKSIVVENIK